MSDITNHVECCQIQVSDVFDTDNWYSDYVYTFDDEYQSKSYGLFGHPEMVGPPTDTIVLGEYGTRLRCPTDYVATALHICSDADGVVVPKPLACVGTADIPYPDYGLICTQLHRYQTKGRWNSTHNLDYNSQHWFWQDKHPTCVNNNQGVMTSLCRSSNDRLDMCSSGGFQEDLIFTCTEIKVTQSKLDDYQTYLDRFYAMAEDDSVDYGGDYGSYDDTGLF